MFPLFIVIYYFFWNDADSTHSTKQNYLCLFEEKQEKVRNKTIDNLLVLLKVINI